MSLRSQMLKHLPTQQMLLVLSIHLHWDQAAGHQASEAQGGAVLFWEVTRRLICCYIFTYKYI